MYIVLSFSVLSFCNFLWMIESVGLTGILGNRDLISNDNWINCSSNCTSFNICLKWRESLMYDFALRARGWMILWSSLHNLYVGSQVWLITGLPGKLSCGLWVVTKPISLRNRRSFNDDRALIETHDPGLHNSTTVWCNIYAELQQIYRILQKIIFDFFIHLEQILIPFRAELLRWIAAFFRKLIFEWREFRRSLSTQNSFIKTFEERFFTLDTQHAHGTSFDLFEKILVPISSTTTHFEFSFNLLTSHIFDNICTISFPKVKPTSEQSIMMDVFRGAASIAFCLLSIR